MSEAGQDARILRPVSESWILDLQLPSL